MSIIRLTHADLKWPFEGKPYVTFNSGIQTETVYLDPKPCNPHDYQTVRAEMKHCLSKVAFPYEPTCVILPFGTDSGTNGWADKNSTYAEKPENRKIFPFIVLQGKPIPIHPAMTRYLVAHELGHIVAYTLEFQRQISTEDLMREYAKMRGIEYNTEYGPMGWADSTTEVVANDCRMVLFERETEWWQHPCPRPDEKVKAWWLEQIDKHFRSKVAQLAEQSTLGATL